MAIVSTGYSDGRLHITVGDKEIGDGLAGTAQKTPVQELLVLCAKYGLVSGVTGTSVDLDGLGDEGYRFNATAKKHVAEHIMALANKFDNKTAFVNFKASGMSELFGDDAEDEVDFDIIA